MRIARNSEKENTGRKDFKAWLKRGKTTKNDIFRHDKKGHLIRSRFKRIVATFLTAGLNY